MGAPLATDSQGLLQSTVFELQERADAAADCRVRATHCCAKERNTGRHWRFPACGSVFGGVLVNMRARLCVRIPWIAAWKGHRHNMGEARRRCTQALLSPYKGRRILFSSLLTSDVQEVFCARCGRQEGPPFPREAGPSLHSDGKGFSTTGCLWGIIRALCVTVPFVGAPVVVMPDRRGREDPFSCCMCKILEAREPSTTTPGLILSGDVKLRDLMLPGRLL